MSDFKNFLNEKYYRLDDKTVGNEFYVLQRDVQSMYKSLSNGNDFNAGDWKQIKSLIDKIDKSIQEHK